VGDGGGGVEVRVGGRQGEQEKKRRRRRQKRGLGWVVKIVDEGRGEERRAGKGEEEKRGRIFGAIDKLLGAGDW